jgi:hypothetical protein
MNTDIMEVEIFLSLYDLCSVHLESVYFWAEMSSRMRHHVSELLFPDVSKERNSVIFKTLKVQSEF